MGEIAVLRPQDPLKTNRFTRQNHLNHSRRKPISDASKPRKAHQKTSPPPTKPNLVMGQVKILKRGETITEVNNKKANHQTIGVHNLVVCSTGRLGPEPEMLEKAMKGVVNFYAGSGVFDSPEPSCLPVPSFFVKKSVDPTTEIRRMLGLNLK